MRLTMFEAGIAYSHKSTNIETYQKNKYNYKVVTL